MAALYDVSDYTVLKVVGGGGSITVLKLHKLVYYIQAWSLAFGKGRMFDGKFQAWVHGPVSRQLYDRYPDKSMYSSVSYEDMAAGFNPGRLNDQERAIIDSVLEAYGDFAGYQLEEMTHRELPWIEARGEVPPSARSESLISDETMASFYGARLKTQ